MGPYFPSFAKTGSPDLALELEKSGYADYVGEVVA